MPDDIDAQLTFNGSAGTTYSYDTTSLSAGDSLRFALQADASSLSTGRYDYSVELTANDTSGSTSRTFSGSQDVVNRSSSTHPFGRGWQLDGLDELVVDSGGALWVRSDGTSLCGLPTMVPADSSLPKATCRFLIWSRMSTTR